MIKTCSAIIAALLACDAQVQAAHVQQQNMGGLDLAQEVDLERKHRKQHKNHHHKAKKQLNNEITSKIQGKVADNRVQQEYLMKQHQAVERMREQKHSADDEDDHEEHVASADDDLGLGGKGNSKPEKFQRGKWRDGDDDGRDDWKASEVKDDDDEQEHEHKKAKSVIEKQEEDEIRRAAEFQETSVDVIKAKIKVKELGKEEVEIKKDLAKAKEMVAQAEFKLKTARSDRQRDETEKELYDLEDWRNEEQDDLDDKKREIDNANADALQAMKDAPVEATSAQQINKEKRESFSEEAEAETRIETARKELKRRNSAYQEEVIEQKIKDAKLKKREALIKRSRAYAKEEKSKETDAIAGRAGADETKDGVEEADDKNKTAEYFKAVTQNAVQDLERAIKTEEAIRARLEAAEDREDEINRKVDLQNAKLSHENAKKALIKAEKDHEAAEQREKLRKVKEKVTEEKMEEQYDEEEGEKERKIKQLKHRAKRVKHRRSSPKHDEEVYDALKEGRRQANEEVYGDDEASADAVDGADNTAAAAAREDEPEPETNSEAQVNKMRDYFKKSNVYQNYRKEQQDEVDENQRIAQTQQEIQNVKQKMVQLMGKYGSLQSRVKQQNMMAKHLQEVEVDRLQSQRMQTESFKKHDSESVAEKPIPHQEHKATKPVAVAVVKKPQPGAEKKQEETKKMVETAAPAKKQDAPTNTTVKVTAAIQQVPQPQSLVQQSDVNLNQKKEKDNTGPGPAATVVGTPRPTAAVAKPIVKKKAEPSKPAAPAATNATASNVTVQAPQSQVAVNSTPSKDNQTAPKTMVQSNQTSNVTQNISAVQAPAPVVAKTNVSVPPAQSNKTTAPPSNKTLLQIREYPGQNVQKLAQGYEGMFVEDKRQFDFEDEGDYVQLRSSEYPHQNIQNLAQGYEGMFDQDKRVFPEFEDEGDYVQLREAEYPHNNIQNLAQGYEGMFTEDKRMFPEFENVGDY